MLHLIHSSHLGVEKCHSRARDVLYWPGMNGQINDVVSKCSVCLANRRSQSREPMIPHGVPDTRWQKLATDIFELDGKHYLVLVDHFTKFPEIAFLELTTSNAVIKQLKSQFARHRVSR